MSQAEQDKWYDELSLLEGIQVDYDGTVIAVFINDIYEVWSHVS